MKTSRPALQTKAQEECGVWLDTVQLKGKAKQKRPTRPIRPISKMLNPFAGGSGYSLAVALNFTQTKMEMPKTKQSSISAFFTRQPRVPSKKSTSEVPNMDPGQTSPPSPSTAPVVSGIKRRRGICHEKPDSQSGVDQEWKSESLTESAVSQEPGEENVMPSQNMFCHFDEEQSDELYPPQSKRRFADTSSLADDSQPPPQAWSQDPLFTYSQYCDSEPYQTYQGFNESAFLGSLQNEESIGFELEINRRTSTQKSSKNIPSSQFENDKENNGYFFSKSPKKLSSFSTNEPLSHHEWTQPKTPPRKHTKDQLCTADKEERDMSHFKKTKPSRSPLKKQAQKQQSKGMDEDSLNMLFTQDSEGFRVIAHRGLQVRSPLKESNNSTGAVRTGAYKSLVEEEEEEEDEMLFTQDSQGNVVIKH
ncbi:aurora kinase A and ninein-interacting protein [Solea solea]|uniref:aurora kinase A and ninein-interacting protein n=1 Tax=Solea solea TaxID=90069 RepID=UPI00272BE484|nr:aurora kinase A and ninein-interacting protein [Solea solea]